MKKLIIILFMFSFCLNAQTVRTFQLSEDWSFKPDKQLHFISGIIVSSAVFLPVAHKTNDIDLAFRAACIGTSFAAMGKEFADVTQGKEISFADMSYTIGSGIITAYVFRAIARKRKKNFDRRFDIEF